MNNPPATEDRIWAVISHLSVLALGIGIPLPIIGWSDRRYRSKYASFQCLQALGYHSLGYTIWVLLSLLVVLASSIAFIAGVENVETELPAWILAHLFVIFGLIGLYFILPVAAAIACVLGKDFRYPILGNRLAKYLGYEPESLGDKRTWLVEAHEERWISAMGHFSVLIMLWGMLAPSTAWILHGKRSTFLKFQSIQTVVYQAGTTLLYFVVFVLYGFGLISLILSMGLAGRVQASSAPEITGILIFGVSLLVALVVALVIPALHIVGQWAGYRVLKGDDFRYPFVGRLVDRWMAKQASGLARNGGLSNEEKLK